MRSLTGWWSVVVVVGLLFLAGCQTGGPGGPQATSPGAEPNANPTAAADAAGRPNAASQANPTNASVRTVSVTASGQATAPPDLALVRVAVVATADDAATAREQVAADSRRMRDALEGVGVGNESLRTAYFSIDAVYNGSRVVGYRAVHAFEIEAGVDEAGRVVDTAVENGADRVDGVAFTLTEETRRQVRRQALTEATENARADAEAVASAAGVTITTVRSASTVDVGLLPVEQARATPSDVQPGPVTVTAEVHVVYDVEDE